MSQFGVGNWACAALLRGVKFSKNGSKRLFVEDGAGLVIIETAVFLPDSDRTLSVHYDDDDGVGRVELAESGLARRGAAVVDQAHLKDCDGRHGAVVEPAPTTSATMHANIVFPSHEQPAVEQALWRKVAKRLSLNATWIPRDVLGSTP